MEGMTIMFESKYIDANQSVHKYLAANYQIYLNRNLNICINQHPDHHNSGGCIQDIVPGPLTSHKD